jgi:hypothetical protein
VILDLLDPDGLEGGIADVVGDLDDPDPAHGGAGRGSEG